MIPLARKQHDNRGGFQYFRQLMTVLGFLFFVVHTHAASLCEDILAGQTQRYRIEKRLTAAEQQLFVPRGQEIEYVEPFAAAFNRGRWEHVLLDTTKSPPDLQMRLGHAALKKGLISETQFASLLLRLSAIHSFAEGTSERLKQIEIISADGKITSEAEALLRRFSPDEVGVGGNRTMSPGLTAAELVEFTNHLAKLPRSEHFFWTIDFNTPTTRRYGKLPMAQDERYSPFFMYPEGAVRVKKMSSRVFWASCLIPRIRFYTSLVGRQ